MAVDFGSLTRKHGVKICAVFPCSVEQCALAVGQVVGHSHVKSAARMNSAVVIFIDKLDKVNALVEAGVVINETLVPVVPLAQPAKRVTLSNVPPFISDDFLRRELSRHGKIVSPIKKLLSGCKSPLLKHVVSHRRQVYMIFNNRHQDLEVAFNVKVEDFEYILFASTKTIKCFSCGKEGHVVRACPEKGKDPGEGTSCNDASAGPGSNTGQIDNNGGSQVDRQVRKEGEQVEQVEGGKEGSQDEEVDGLSHGTSGQMEEADGQERETVRPVGEERSRQGGEIERQVEEESRLVEDTERQVGETNGQVEERERQVEGTGGQGEEIDKQVEEESRQVGETGGQAEESRQVQEGNRQVEEGSRQVEAADSQKEVLGEQREEGQGEDMELPDEEDGLKSAIGLKRKTKKSESGSKQAKKESVDRPSLQSDSSSSDWDSDDASVSGLKVTASQEELAYTAEKIKHFLQITKNTRGVKVVDYFSDKAKFITSASIHMRQREKSGLTDQEVYRLKKVVLKLKRQLNEGEPGNEAGPST